MSDKLLLLTSGKQDAFWQWIVEASPVPNQVYEIYSVDQVTEALAQRLTTILAVIIPLMPQYPRISCEGFDRFLEFKHLEHAADCDIIRPARVIPTIFCSFLSKSQFLHCLDRRFGARLGRFMQLLCVSHKRMPFDAPSLDTSVSTAIEDAEAAARVPYHTAVKIAISEYRPHAEVPNRTPNVQSRSCQ